ncbi:MAG: hypothetical protein FWD57_15405 [Polyangiaceae bacterium]|nr:hypothetical protein [Polyangiaceae bacterium]
MASLDYSPSTRLLEGGVATGVATGTATGVARVVNSAMGDGFVDRTG